MSAIAMDVRLALASQLARAWAVSTFAACVRSIMASNPWSGSMGCGQVQDHGKVVCVATAPCTAVQGLKRCVLQTVGSIHSQVRCVLRRADLSDEPGATQKLPEQLQSLFGSIDSLRHECEAVSGPPELPDLSDSIEHIEVRGTP